MGVTDQIQDAALLQHGLTYTLLLLLLCTLTFTPFLPAPLLPIRSKVGTCKCIPKIVRNLQYCTRGRKVLQLVVHTTTYIALACIYTQSRGWAGYPAPIKLLVQLYLAMNNATIS